MMCGPLVLSKRTLAATTHVLETRGFRYVYSRWGDAQAPAVVLLMGLGLPKEAWPQGIITGLLAEGFQVIAPDNRDCGGSSRISSWQPTGRDVLSAIARALLGRRVVGKYALEDMALDLERLLDALDIRRAHIVGISMGGMIAQVFATQCPNRAATLVSISSAVGNPRTGFGSLRAIAAVASMRPSEKSRDALEHYRHILKVLSGPKYPPTSAEFEAVEAAQMSFDALATRRQLIALLASGNRSRQVRELRVPTLVIHGKSDPLLPFEAGKETAELIPGAKLLAVEGLGHQLPPVLMDTYVRAIAELCHAHPA